MCSPRFTPVIPFSMRQTVDWLTPAILAQCSLLELPLCSLFYDFVPDRFGHDHPVVSPAL